MRLFLCALAMFVLSLAPNTAAAQSPPIQYGYDELGRLVVVVDQTGDTAIYNYDLVGNLLSIQRIDPSQVPGAVAITHFTPQAGKVGATVSIFGKGFSATASQNTISFNDGLATIKSASANRLIVTVPASALTGPISVTSPLGSATSSASFRLLGPLSISPASASLNAGGTFQFTATGVGGVTPTIDWSVNGVLGGNATIGTISVTGLYTAPAYLPQALALTIKAADHDDATNAASAAVTVVATGTMLFSAAKDVSVTFPERIFIVGSVGTSVSASVTQPRSGASAAEMSAYVGGSSSAVATAPPVSGTFEPFIAAVTPATVGRGANNATVTLTGSGFDGAAAVFALLGQAPDPTVTVSVSSVSADGTHAILMVTVASNAALGARVIRFGTSTDVNTGVNTLTVGSQTTPTISWNAPAPITYGTALSSAQLNATASVGGTFVYTPAAGTVLGAGNGQTLTVLFTPTDTATYTPAEKTVTIDVATATPTITWTAPADITYGTALSVTQLSATASVPGTFAYDPPAGTVLTAGTRTLTTTFTPTDGTYTTVTVSVSINVLPAAPTITWSAPADIAYGTALSEAQLNATASVEGTFVYDPPAGTVPGVGSRTLSVTFTPTDTTDYTTASATVTLRVSAADQAITVTTPAPASAAYQSQFSVAATGGGSGNAVMIAASGACAGGGSGTATVTMTNGTGTCTVAYDEAGTDQYNAAPGVTSTTSATKLSVTVSLTTSVVTGPAAVFTAGVQSTSGTPRGTVTFAIDGTTFDTEPLVNGTATSAPFTTPEGSEAHAVVALYGGDDNFLASSSAPLTDTTPSTSRAAYAAFADTTLTIGAPGVLTNDNVGGAAQMLTAVLVSGPTMASGPAAGVLTLNADGSFTYVPAASDGFGEVTFTYTPFDGTLYGPETTVTITVLDPATPPAIVALNDAYSVTADASVTVGAPGVSGNDQGQTLTIQSVVSGPTFGTLTLNAAAGSFTYTPAPGFTGVDSFLYRATDGTAVSNLAMVTITVVPASATVTATNDAYLADATTLPFATSALGLPGVLGNDQGQGLTAAIVTGPLYGAVSLALDGSFTYTPAPSFVGVDSFVYRATDGTSGALAMATIRVPVITMTPATVTYNPSVQRVVTETVTGVGATGAVTLTVDTGAPQGPLALDANGQAAFTIGSPTAGSHTLTATYTNLDFYGTSVKTGTLQVNAARPTVTWGHPAAITYPTPLSSTQLDATASVPGTFVYTPQEGTVLNAGNGQTLSVTFTPTDTANYLAVTKTTTITVRREVSVVTWPTPVAIAYGTALDGTQLNATASVPGTFVYTPAAGTVLSAGSGQVLSVTFTPTDTVDDTTVTTTVRINVLKAAPTITWSTPADITYGTALDGTQLNAIASVPGTFVYTPPAGTVLNGGAGRALSVRFTPTDTANYAVTTVSVQINVLPATPVITWNTPAAITYGTSLKAAQLNATASAGGSFTYSPPTGTVLDAGSYPLTVTFTPSNSVNYTTATATVTLQVNQATPTITWNTPAAITYGTALSGTQLNASARGVVSGALAGSFDYTPPAGTALNAGNGQTLSMTFTPDDTTNYTTATKTVTIDIRQATPAIAWSHPAAITYPTPLSSMQLNATASVPGTFDYMPPDGTVLDAGTGQTLSVTFTPTDTANYTTATKTVTITVRQAKPVITWSRPAAITYPTPLSSAQLNATASVPGTFDYTPPDGTVLNAGTGQTLSVTFTPTDTTNYTTVTKTVTINVRP